MIITLVRFGLSIAEAKEKLEKDLQEYLDDGWEKYDNWTVRYDKNMEGYNIIQNIRRGE